MKTISFLCLLFFSISAFSQERKIAITIDDLPLVGAKMNTPANRERATERFMNMVKVLNKYQVPATGFVIAGAIDKGQWAFLEHFHDAGLIIGNHTYSHGNLNKMGADEYIADVDKADKILSPLLTDMKFFRYPYLAEGINSSSKIKVLNYLKQNNYIVAPVTIDSKDFKFNSELYRIPYRQREQFILSKMKPRYLNYIWKQTLRAEQEKGKSTKQILLIHANLLNSYLLEDILKMYQDNGYQFISLAEALEDTINPIQLPSPTLHNYEQTEEYNEEVL